MPCILKIRIVAARGLPIMDRGSGSTDAYVEVIFGDQDVVRTQICKGTLNPVWNEDFRFEIVDDGRLQVDPLELKVMDYDQITYNDSIGVVWVDLNPLLTWDSEGQISGWMPIYDTLRGICGELKIQVKLQFFGDVNPFKDSSAGVQFFTIGTLPPNVKITRIMGYVSALETEDDPEHHWSDNFRTPRTSNEARIRLMYRLSGQLRRQLGMKALELNGNAVIGFQQHFDIESDNRMLVARASGNVVKLIYEHGHLYKKKVNKLRDLDYSEHINSNKDSANVENKKNADISVNNIPEKKDNSNNINSNLELESADKPISASIQDEMKNSAGYLVENETDKLNNIDDLQNEDRNASEIDDIDLDEEIAEGKINPKQQPIISSSFSTTVNIYTVDSFPPHTILSVGGLVCAISVKVLDDDDRDSRESWWNELKEELKSHAKSLRCSSIIGYCEFVSIYEDVAVLQCQGTAANLDTHKWLEFENIIAPAFGISTYDETKSESQSLRRTDSVKGVSILQDTTNTENHFAGISSSADNTDKSKNVEVRSKIKSLSINHNCKLCHIPYSRSSAPFPTAYYLCAVCKKPKRYVPEVLLLTVDPPKELETVGDSVLIEAHVFRNKKLEGSLINVGDMIPFMQYDAHRQLLYKLRLYGLNAIFSLRIQITMGESGALVVASGTAAYIRALPLPSPMKVHRNLQVIDEEDRKLFELQRKIMETSENNRNLIEQELLALESEDESDDNSDDDNVSESSLSSSSDSDSSGSVRHKRGYVVHIDDEQDEDLVLLITPYLPESFRLYNSGNGTMSDKFFNNDQKYSFTKLITLVKQRKISSNEHHPNQFLAELFRTIYEEMQLSVSFLKPCVIARISHQVQLIDDDIIQIHLTAVIMGNQDEASFARKDFMLTKDNLTKLQLIDQGDSFDITVTNNSTKATNENDALARKVLDGKKTFTDINDNASSIATTSQSVNLSSSAAEPHANGQKTTIGMYSGLTSGGILETAVNFQNYLKNHLRQSNVKTNRKPGKFSSYISNSLMAIKGGDKRESFSIRSSKVSSQDIEINLLSRKMLGQTAFNFIPSLQGVKEIFITPLSYVPNHVINNFLGRISLHFVRESSVQVHDGAGSFTQSFWREIFSLVKSQARAIGGDCVLRFVVDQSTINEDGKHISYGFISISGDICTLRKNNSTSISDSETSSIDIENSPEIEKIPNDRKSIDNIVSPTRVLKSEFSQYVLQHFQ